MVKRTKNSAIYVAIGSNIAIWRKVKNKTQQEIADRLGITQSAYARIEAGEVQIRVDQLLMVAEALGGIKPYQLLGSLLE